MSKYYHIVAHYWKKNFIIPILLFISLGVVAFYTYGGEQEIGSFYNYFVDPVFSIFSILLTVGLTMMYAKTEWVNTLPHRLNVHFINTKGKYLASCYNVHVMPNSDLRTLGQQVGAQMFENQQLKFNPSLKLNVQNEPIRVKNSSGKSCWVKYSDVNFYLTTDQYNENSAYYTVWNINEKEHDSLKLEPGTQPLHDNEISTKELLSDDGLSAVAFKTLQKINIQTGVKLYIVNSPIIDGAGMYDYQIIDKTQAISFIRGRSFISAIGHESTAEVLSAILGTKVEHNRIQIQLNKGDQCLVFRIKERIEEGRVYTRDDIEKMNTELGILTKNRAE
ncbi:MAG: DUF1874 domain-containing protein [Saprospiraceae bacterium]|nr:DUF1874 domain-containing protein [Saprospiraceae bacterium]